MRRRDILLGFAGLSGAASIIGVSNWVRSAVIPSYSALPEGMWANWSRNQISEPKSLVKVRDLDHLKSTLRSSTGIVRIAGSGHSFSGLVPTEDTIISLESLSGIISTDKESMQAKVFAGSRLHDLSRDLESKGMAFKNLGDVDVQSLAGAVSTATHGTGKSFPCLSAEITGAKIMTASGELITISGDENSDMLNAVQVSLGALGIIVEVDISLRSNFKLHRKTWTQSLSETLSGAESLWRKHRNFEFYYIPYSGQTLCISNEITDAPPTIRPESSDDESVMKLKRARDFLNRTPKLRRKLISSALENAPMENAVGPSWKLLATERNVRFNEMEYHLPVKTALETLEQIISIIETQRPDVFFPIEVRRTAADNAYLSPFQGAERISIAVHCFQPEDFTWMFDLIEPIFKKAGGRPHWGKLHSITAAELSGMYPDFSRFSKLRTELDPNGRFLSPYMRKLLVKT